MDVHNTGFELREYCTARNCQYKISLNNSRLRHFNRETIIYFADEHVDRLVDEIA